MSPSVLVVSFGYLHAMPPVVTVVLDVRHVLHDPHVDPAMRQMTGLDDKVHDHVLATPGAAEILDRLQGLVEQLLTLSDGLITVAVGCAGGRHRSVVLARELAARLEAAGHTAHVRHLHVDRDVVRRAS